MGLGHGSGDFELSGTAKKLRLQMLGSGSLQASALLLEEASVKVSGSGEAVVKVQSKLNAAPRVVKMDRSGVLE